jgi:Flp pilus assembly protein TadD
MRMRPLPPPDSHHLSAAHGWLGLGCPEDSRQELARIAPENQFHPDVLETRWMIATHERDWPAALTMADQEVELYPDDVSGWLHRAYAVRRIPDGGLLLARAALMPAAEQFPSEPIVAYNLACYDCQLGQLDDARAWLDRAIRIGDPDEIRKLALADEDLKPLWPELKPLRTKS